MKTQTPTNPKITSHHFVVFLLTFFSYAFFHATRKTFSNVKTTISEEWTPSFHNSTINETKPDRIWNSHTLFETTKKAEPFLGILDGAFLISYAVGLYISGIVGDRLDLASSQAKYDLCSNIHGYCIQKQFCLSYLWTNSL